MKRNDDLHFFPFRIQISIFQHSLLIHVNDSSLGVARREIDYVPGFYKIFDEVLVNAADNFQRDRNQTTIRVDIDIANQSISVYNDGRGTPQFT